MSDKARDVIGEENPLQAPKEIVDGLVEIFNGFARMFAGISEQLEQMELLAPVDDEKRVAFPAQIVPTVVEKKTNAVPRPRKKPIKKTHKPEAPLPLEEAELNTAPEDVVEEETEAEENTTATEEDAEAQEDTEAQEDAENSPPWQEDTGQKEGAAATTTVQPATQPSITKDDITAVIVAKIKQKRANNEKIGQLLKTYSAGALSDLPAEKYEAFLTDISQL